MPDYLHMDKNSSGISLSLDAGHEMPANIGRALGTVLSGADWDALLRCYLKSNAPELLDAIHSTASETGLYKALFAPEFDALAVQYERTIRSLVEDGTELRRLLREEYDEIWPEEED